MLSYIESKEAVFIFITFLIGRYSPHYEDTLTYPGENWDYCRNVNINPDTIIQIVYSIFKNSIEQHSENQLNLNNKSFVENNVIINTDWKSEQTEKQDKINNNNDNNSNCSLSERDLNCIKNSDFLKIAFKFNKKYYTEIIKHLCKNNKEFSIDCSIQLTEFLDDVLTISGNEIIEIINCISPLLEIEDEYQLLRFGIILGYPQLIIDEATVETKFANFGYNAMIDIFSRIIEVKNSVGNKNSVCLMKKVFDCYSKDADFIEIYLVLIQAAVGNLALLKYLRAFICEDYIGEE